MQHNSDFVHLVSSFRPKVKTCEIQDLKKKQQQQSNTVLIDIREDNEVAKGMIEGAIHIGRGVLERDIHKHITEKDQEIILYCGGGSRSILAAYFLQEMGYTQVYSMNGGYRGWGAS